LKEGFLKASGPCDFWLLRERIIFFVDIKQFMREQPYQSLEPNHHRLLHFQCQKKVHEERNSLILYIFRVGEQLLLLERERIEWIFLLSWPF
jgi:hypothetical protein